ncbi:hypothetical protein Tco_1272109, partial [Tanacetum coccineum]
ASTPVDLEKPLVKDGDADDVDVHLYRSMIGSLMYLIASRLDIMFAVCAYARFQVTPNTSHLLAVKRIFRYLKGKPTLGLWYSRDFPFELFAYTDSDYAGATQDRKSTTGGYQFLGNRLISWQCKKQTMVATSTTKAKYVAAASYYRQVGDEAVHKELGNKMERAANIASSLKVEQDSDAQTWFETASKQSNDPPLSRVNTLRSGEDSMKLMELMAHCTKLSELHNMVAYLEKSEGSEGFHEIIDFLSASHIYYALTTSPTIYTSLIEKFWQTAALCTIDDGVLGITATIDRKVKITVSEGSIRRHLKLEDSEGIPSLPTIEIFEQLTLMGGEEPSIQTIPKTSLSKITSSPSLSSHYTSISAPSTSQPPIIPTEEPAPMPHESPLYSVYSLGRDEGSMQQHELMNLVTKLIDRIRVLEKDLQQTKKTYSTALTRIILRVKKLEKTVKTGKARIQDMDYDFDVSTAEGFTTASISVTTSSTSISIVSPPRVSTAEDISGVKTLVYIRRSASKAKDKGKAIMQESNPSKKIKKRETRFKQEQEQERIDFETALELQKKLDEREEVPAKEAHDINWSDPFVLRYHALQNRPFSVAEVRKNMCMYLKNQGSEKKTRGRRKKSLARKRAREILGEESAKKQKLEDDAEKEELQVYLNIVPEEESLDVESLATKQDVLELYILVKDRFQTASPEGYDLLLWGDLKSLIEPNKEDEIWRNQPN